MTKTPPVSDIDTTIPADWRDRTTIDVPTAGAIIGVCRNTAYDGARSGEIPTIRLGRKLVVPVAPLRRLLGELPAGTEVGGGDTRQR